MRKIVLTPNDFEMFDTEIGSVEYEFFHKHKDAFKRMWIEQGKKFWIQFIMSYRQYAVDYGTIKEFPAKNDHFEDFVDQAFIVIHENFVEGRFGLARSFITDIVLVAQNRHTLQYLESKSYAKDPFYNKETRDVFRRLFGPPNEKSSYLKVYILFPIYMKYAGAVCICLRRWLEADDIHSDAEENNKLDSSHASEHKIDKPPETTTTKSSSNVGSDRVSPTLSDLMDTEDIYATVASPRPRIIELEDEKESRKEKKEEKGGDGDRPGSQLKVVGLKELKAIGDGGGGDYHELALLSDSDEYDEMESLYRDGPHRMRKEMMRRRMLMEERQMEFFDEDDHEFFKMYIHEVKDGSKKGPLFVRGWPTEVDPRVTDPDNPIYDPSNKKPDWKDGLRLPNFAKFVKYVRENYRRGVKMTEDERSHRKRMKHLEDLRDNQMEENLSRTLSSKKAGMKTEAFTIKLDDHKQKEAQEEKKRKRKLRKKIKKGLPVSQAELAAVKGSSQRGPVAALLTDTMGEPNQDAIKRGTQCPTCFNPMIKNPKTGGSKCSNVKCSLPLKGPSGGFQLAPGVSSIQVDLDDHSFKIENPSNGSKPDPRKPYILDKKQKSTPKHVEPKRVEHRKDMDAFPPPDIEPNSVKLTKKVDEKKGTVTLTVEKRDGKGNTTTETTIKPLNGEDDGKIWEEAMSKLTPIGAPPTPPVLNEKVQREIIAKMSKQKMLEPAPSARSSASKSSKAVANKSSSSSQTVASDQMEEMDKKQFREMYKEVSTAISEVSRNAQYEDEPEGCSFMCNHDSRHEKARNRLRRKLGERKQDRKHPDLPGLVRLGGMVEYPADENQAMMLTVAEMTKMSPAQKELFQEKLGRTKYFRDQDDPRDVVDYMKETLKDEKAKSKKAKIREQEKLEISRRVQKKQAEMREEMVRPKERDWPLIAQPLHPGDGPLIRKMEAASTTDAKKQNSSEEEPSSRACKDIPAEKKDDETLKIPVQATTVEDVKVKVDATSQNGSVDGKTKTVHAKPEKDSVDYRESQSNAVMEERDITSDKKATDAESEPKGLSKEEEARNDRKDPVDAKETKAKAPIEDSKTRSESRGSVDVTASDLKPVSGDGELKPVSGEGKSASVKSDSRSKATSDNGGPAKEKRDTGQCDSDNSDSISMKDLKRIIKYKDDVKKMKENLHFSAQRMYRLLDKQRNNSSQEKTSREFTLRIIDANRELRRIEEKITILDRECENLDDSNFTKNVQRAAEELRHVKRKVKQWEEDAEMLTKALQQFEEGENSFGAILEVTGMTKEELLGDEQVKRVLQDAASAFDTHPPGHPEVTPEILEQSRNREIDQDKVLRDFADIISDKVMIRGYEEQINSGQEDTDNAQKESLFRGVVNTLRDRDILHEEDIDRIKADIEQIELSRRKENKQQEWSQSRRRKAKFMSLTDSDIEEEEKEATKRYVDSLFAESPKPPQPPPTKPSAHVETQPKQLATEPTEDKEQKPKAEDTAAKPSKPVRAGTGPSTIERVSYKLSHPVGGRVEDKRSPQQKMKDSEKYSEMPSTVKSPEKKSRMKKYVFDDTCDVKKTKDKSTSKGPRICSGCGKSEPSPKTFKKCQKCKEEQIKNSRYYCGKECQADDWRKRHKIEHKEKRLE